MSIKNHDYQLDARNLLCPFPVIRNQDCIKTLKAGAVLTVLCTDPGVLKDIPAWCRINGHTMLETRSTPEHIIITIQVH